MAKLIIDIVEANDGNYTEDVFGDSASGVWECSRIATVTNIGGTGTTKLRQAVKHVDMPRIGAYHPDASLNAKLYTIECMSIDADAMKLRLKYRRGNWQEGAVTIIEADGTLEQTETNKDYLGNVVKVGYHYPEDDSGVMTETGVLMPKSIPQHTLVFRRKENGSPYALGYLPYIGKINSIDWVEVDDAFCWFCTGIRSVGSNRAIYWENEYTFQYNPDGWDVHAVFLDEETGRPPIDLDSAGDKWVSIYETANFNLLGLLP